MSRKVESKTGRGEVYCKCKVVFSQPDIAELWKLFGGSKSLDVFKAQLEAIAADYKRARRQDEDTASTAGVNQALRQLAEAARAALLGPEAAPALARQLAGLNPAAEFVLGVEVKKRTNFASGVEALNSLAMAPLAHAQVIRASALAAISASRGPEHHLTLQVALDALVRLYEQPAKFGIEGVDDRPATHSLHWLDTGGTEPGSPAGRFLRAAMALIDPAVAQTRVSTFLTRWVSQKRR